MQLPLVLLVELEKENGNDGHGKIEVISHLQIPFEVLQIGFHRREPQKEVSALNLVQLALQLVD